MCVCVRACVFVCARACVCVYARVCVCTCNHSMVVFLAHRYKT